VGRCRRMRSHGAQASEPAREGPARLREELTEEVPRDDPRRHGHCRRADADVLHEEIAPRCFAPSLRIPRLQWTALRTANVLERINEEFRRRTRTQSSPLARASFSYCCLDSADPPREARAFVGRLSGMEVTAKVAAYQRPRCSRSKPFPRYGPSRYKYVLTATFGNATYASACAPLSARGWRT
jgi:hypothetical protein